MVVVNLIVWTCAVVFICTAIITLLSVINVLKIENRYREKLFYALLIEIVVCSLTVFRANVLNPYLNRIRISAPLAGTNTSVSVTNDASAFNNNSLHEIFVSGSCEKQPGSKFAGEVEVNNKKYTLINFSLDDSNIFSAHTEILNSDTLRQFGAKVSVRIVDKGKVLDADTSEIKITFVK